MKLVKLALKQGCSNNEDDCEENESEIDDPFHISSDEDPDYKLPENEITTSDSDSQDFNIPEDTEILPSVLKDLPNEMNDNPQRNRRKRKTPKLWKQNVRMQKRNSGQSYVNSTRKEVQARRPTIACNNNCKYRCSDFIDPEGRQIIC